MSLSDIHIYLKHPERLDGNSLPLLKTVVERYPVFQAGWILLLKNLRKLNSPEFDDYLQKSAIRITDRRKLFYFLMTDDVELTEKHSTDELELLSNAYLSPGAYHLKTAEDKEESLTELVKSLRRKQFISEESNQDAGRQDVSVKNTTGDYVTETLAKIYARQGLYKEAIQAYEKLSLKYPEKNTYFGGQVEEIKKLMN